MHNLSERWPGAVKDVDLLLDDVVLKGELCLPRNAKGLVVFVHGSGSSRHSPRSRFVAGVLNQANLATLLFDLFTAKEESIDIAYGHLRFDIGLLARRVVAASKWLLENPETSNLQMGYFGASTGAAAALVAASRRPNLVSAVVSRSGRPDLAGDALRDVLAPTLLIVGGDDHTVLRLNAEALELLLCRKELAVVPNASHLFEERGSLEKAANLASAWFSKYLATPRVI